MKPSTERVAQIAGRKDRILCIGKRFYTNKDTLLEQFGRVYRLPMLWAGQGASVLLWLVDYHTRTPIEQQTGDFRVRSTPALSLAWFRMLFASMCLRPDTVVASGDCYVGLLGWTLARLTGARFVFDIYDKYDEFGGYRRLPGFDPFRFLRAHADLRLFCSRGLERLYAAEPSGGPSLVVPNGVDESTFVPLPGDECRRQLGLALDSVLVGYFGSMEPDRGVGDLLGAMEILREEGLDVRLLICGKAELAMPLDRDWINFCGMVPHDRMPLYLNSCDLLVVPYRESAIMEMGASCKIAEYLMCARPLVSTSTGNFTSNFPLQAAELGTGMCPPGNVPALARSIRSQLAERRLLTPPTDMGWAAIAATALDAIRHTGRVAA